MSRKYKMRNQEGMYFLTMTIVGWIDVFSRESYKKIIVESLQYCQEKKGLIVFSYVIMSNHIHMIVMPKEEYLLTDIIRDFKTFTSKKIIAAINSPYESRKDWILPLLHHHAKKKNLKQKHQFWQHGSHPIELYSKAVIHQKMNYIHLNPVKAGWVRKPEDYVYSSARNYASIKSDPPSLSTPKIDITLIR